MNPHYEKLAKTLTDYSLELKKRDTVLIEVIDIPELMVIALTRAVRARGADAVVNIVNSRILREFIMNGSERMFQQYAETELHRMKKTDAYIALRGAYNIFENSDIPSEQMNNYTKAMNPVIQWRIEKTRWVITRWPTPSMAQQALMSTEKFENYFFAACNFDYKRLHAGQKALKALMESTDKVHIQGPGVDLHFSIKGIPAIISEGKYNIPDGEVFTAPVKYSVEGEITYNVPTVYQGVSFDHIYFKFHKGKIIEAKSNNTQRLNEILDSDAGARYIGEFALGLNPMILEPIRDILFDEKIAGSFHFTPGKAYGKADNGNRSNVHWDIVNIQRPEYGGGTISFDGKVVRKDGLFVVKALECLNPKQLLKKK